MNSAAQRLIATLRLEPLPGEGGFFRQTWCSATASAIYFLLTPENFSAWHRLTQDEIWHFYGGDRVELAQIDPATAELRVARLGPDVLAGDSPQVLVRSGTWQAARIATRTAPGTPEGWALLGCTVSPPWDERGSELGGRADLRARFPAHAEWIESLTR